MTVWNIVLLPSIIGLCILRTKNQSTGYSISNIYLKYYIAACPSGTWGRDCQRDCSCRDINTVCNETTGCAECPEGFKGGDCHEDIDECVTSDPCDKHANCSNTVGTFKCICAAGFTLVNTTACQGTFRYNLGINFTLRHSAYFRKC